MQATPIRGDRPELSRESADSQQPGTLPPVRVHDAITAIRSAIQTVVHVEEEILEGLLTALVARGHILLEGIPGIGKTLLARTLARCLDASFSRVQFTNDLMPSDIVGSLVWRPKQERFEFIQGPLFSNLVLADEINRTSPRTLSCLLEAMENGCVTVEGKSLVLARPFLVMATRNPIEFHGTYPIPEAALDRFLMRLQLGYPSEEQECALYRGEDPEVRLDNLKPILDATQLLAIQAAARKLHIEESIISYVQRFAVASREHDAVVLGASPRAALAWIHAARARALIQGRDYVLPDDLKALAVPVLAHRLFLHGGADAGELVDELLAQLPIGL